MSDRRLPGADLRAVLRPAIPDAIVRAGARGATSIPALLASCPGALVVDLGCGRGDSVDAFRAAEPSVRWIGVEVGDSEYETRSDVELRVFDGVALPFEDASVDVVFSKQVLEHVERPHELIPDVARVLQARRRVRRLDVAPRALPRPLDHEPHALRAQAAAGALRLRAGDDHARHRRADAVRAPAAARPARSSTATGRGARRSTRCSTASARITGWDAEDRNAIKLLFSGQYAFVARRTAPA